jgi:hypothetical protein
MTGRSLVAYREDREERTDPYRVYIVYNQGGSILDSLSHPRQLAVIQKEIQTYHATAMFARRAFTTRDVHAVYSDPNLRREIEFTWERLHQSYFDAVWFYGEGLSEFTRAVAMLAMRTRITVVDYSERHSLLNRYLEQWILGKSVSLR